MLTWSENLTREQLWAVPFGDELLATWDALDSRGTHRAAIRWLARNDRYYLLVRLCRRLDAWHPWIFARCREVEASPDGHIDIWSRESYKSTICTFAGIIQEVLRDPEITIAVFSHTKPIAKGFLAQLQREFESNEILKALFPEILWDNASRDAPTWSLDAGLIVKRRGNPKEATIEAHGLVDGQPTSRHFQLLLYDDVVVRESVNTPEQIERTTEAWELSDNVGVAGGRKQILGTRFHFADTYSQIIERGAAKPRIYPATDDGTFAGKPVLFTQAEWDRRVRDQGEAVVASQLLCNPLAGHQRMFDVEDLGVYEVRPETLMVYVLIDPARSVKKGNANTAMAVLGLDAAGNKYVLDGLNHQMDLTHRWINMRDLVLSWERAPGVQGVHVGYERFGAQADCDYFAERMRIEHTHFDITELEWPREGPGSKVDRVQRLTPDLRGHRLFVPYDTDPTQLTKLQRRMRDSGYSYRIARRIVKLDESGAKYDLSEHLRLQLSFFPFAGKVDLVDALSRIYDMDIVTPQAPVMTQDLEPVAV